MKRGYRCLFWLSRAYQEVRKAEVVSKMTPELWTKHFQWKPHNTNLEKNLMASCFRRTNEVCTFIAASTIILQIHRMTTISTDGEWGSATPNLIIKIMLIQEVMSSMMQPLITGIAKALVPYGWTTLVVLHLTSCCLHAHTVDLGITTASIHRMWLCPVAVQILQ